MVAALQRAEQLPTRSSSQVKNAWADVVREVRASGGVAVTHHSKVQMVLVDTQTYSRLVAEVAAGRAKEEAGLLALDRAYESRLAALQEPDARDRVDALLSSHGKLKRAIKAGASF